MSESFDFDVVFGGYYVSRSETGRVSVFRLLDFNEDTCHIALFETQLTANPTRQEFDALTPVVGHLTMNLRGILEGAPQLVGRKPLSFEDLREYACFLQRHGATPGALATSVERCLRLSRAGTFSLRITRVGEQLRIVNRRWLRRMLALARVIGLTALTRPSSQKARFATPKSASRPTASSMFAPVGVVRPIARHA